METISLNNGVVMPLLGFGTMTLFGLEKLTSILRNAYDEGYRLFDCAEIYGNEELVGEAIKRAGIPRKEIFLTTKVWFTHFEKDECKRAVMNSMKNLQTNYVDLVLLHWPYGNTYQAYRELEELYFDGSVRAIGVSNYMASQLEDLIHFNKVIPTVNQVKTSLRCQRLELKGMMKKYGVHMQGYQIFDKEECENLYTSEEFKMIANRHKKSALQIVMRFFMQENQSFISISTTKEHMHSNLELYDFELDKNEMDYLRRQDRLDLNTKPSQDYQTTVEMLKMIDAKKIWLDYAREAEKIHC